METSNRHFLEPDTGANPTTGSAPAISAADSPTGSAIPITPPTAFPAPEIIQPLPVARERGISAPGVKSKAVDVAKELGMTEAPSRAIERLAKATRDKITGRFKPQPTQPRKAKAKPEAAAPTPEPPVAEAPTATPLGEPVVATPAEPKIKFRGEEKTAAEWEKVLADEETARQKPVEPAKPATAAVPQETDDQRRTAFIEQAAEHFAPSQEDFDAMLASGDVKAFGRMMARVAADAREWMVRTVSPHLDRFDSQLTPFTQQQQLIAQYQTEQSFLESNPAIKGHADGLRTMRETSANLRAELEDLLETIAAVPSSPLNATRKERATLLKTAFIQELAKATKAKLGIGDAAPITPRPAAAPAAPRQRPPAQTGLVGTGASPNGKGASGEIAAMRAAGLM